MERGRDHGRRRRRARRDAAPRLPHAGPACSSRLSPPRRSISISCARSTRPMSCACCRTTSSFLARGPFALEDERDLMRARSHRNARHQEQRRRRDPRQDRRPRASWPFRSLCVRAARKPTARRKRADSTRCWPGSRLIGPLRSCAASAATGRRRGARMKRVSLEPISTSVAMSTRPGSASASVVRTTRSSGRPTARAKATGVVAALQAAQQLERVVDLARPRLRGGIVERDDEIAFRRRAAGAARRSPTASDCRTARSRRNHGRAARRAAPRPPAWR